MKIVFLYALYNSYVNQVYGANPALGGESFKKQHDKIIRDGFGNNGAWTAALTPLGYDVLEIFANVAPLQRAWAAEHGLAWSSLNWVTEVTFQQILAFRPDILFLDDPVRFPAAWLKRLREQCPTLRLIVGNFGAPTYDLSALQACNILLSCHKGLIIDFSQKGVPVRYFRHGFNHSVLPSLPERTPCREEVLFTGGIVRAPGFHFNREVLLEQLAKHVPLAIHCPQGSISVGRDFADTTMRRGLYAFMATLKGLGVNTDTLAKLPRIGRAARWEAWPQSQINPSLRPHMRPALYGVEMLARMRTSALTLNTQPETSKVHGGMNMRLFEGTGAGTCLMNDYKDDLCECFEPDKEVVTYRSPEECCEKAAWLLQHPKEREEIAAAGQRRCLRDHTRAVRAIELNEIIRKSLGEIP